MTPNGEPSDAGRRYGYARVRLAVISAVVLTTATALAALLWPFSRSDSLASRKKIEEAFHAVSLGLANFFDAHSRFPPFALTNADGEPLASWRVEILNWVDAGPPKVLQGRWSDPANRQLREQAIWLYCFSRNPSTNLMAISGPGTPFQASYEENAEIDLDAILLVEVKYSEIHWMEPGDFSLDKLAAMKKETPAGEVFGVHPEGFHVAFWDGEVWFLSRKTPMGLLRRFVTVDGAAEHDRDDLLSEYRIE